MARGSDDGFNAWLAARGHTLPVGAPSPAILRQRATDYIDSQYLARIIGDPATDPILTALETATYAAAWHEANKPGSLSASATAAGTLKRKKIEGIEKEYFEGSGDAVADATVRLSLVEGILGPHLRPAPTGASVGLWAVG